MAGKQEAGGSVHERYQELLGRDSGADFVKVDLHVHTPASGDAQSKNRYNFRFDRGDRRQSKKTAESIAADVVQRCIDLDMRLIAVTDHNTPSNVHPEELGLTWFELLCHAADAAKSEHGENTPCILPGVEISTDDLHILVILDPKDGPVARDKKGRHIAPAAFTIHRINTVLRRCGFTLNEYGDYTATGMSSLFDVLQYIEDIGARCIAIPAHIDGGKKAMLSVYKEPSNVFRKLLNHPNLNAVEVVKATTPVRKKIGSGKSGKPVGEYFASQRDPDRSPIAWVQDSDGHSIKDDGLGKRFTYVRMGRPSFSALKNALEDPETRIRLRDELKPDDGKTTMLGLAFRKGSGKWGYVAFNRSMNCIVGKKGTYKSAIIDLVLYGLDRFADTQKATLEQGLIDQKYSADVFIAKGENVYCASRGNKGALPVWFKLEGDTFMSLLDAPDLALPRRYAHEGITGRLTDKARLMEFVDWRVLGNYSGMKAKLRTRDRYLKKAEEKGFKDCASQLTSLRKACKALFDKRTKIKGLEVKKKKSSVEIQLSQYGKKAGKALFMVRIRKAKGAGSRRESYIDQASVHVLVGTKYKSLTSLSAGMKNAAVMAFLMNQDAFGPLIIDEPEQYLDVSAITGVLVPRMRALKTKQQIICVTKDEHILLSGDAEHVIATQSEKGIEVIAGDTNDRKIQEQILEIFEGDAEGRELRKKRRKLAGILDEH